MRATFDLSPAGPLIPVLEALAEGLVALNSIWLAEQIARGGDPPCCTACAGPPWTAGNGVDYIPFHGDTPKGTERRYVDGPTMFAEGRGTCFDAACYDCACLRVKEQTAARVRILPVDLAGEFHAIVVLPNGETKDPARELLERGAFNVGAVRKRGVIVRRGSVPRNIGANANPSALTVERFNAMTNVGGVRVLRPESTWIPSAASAASVRRGQLGADVRGGAASSGSAYGSTSIRSSCRSCGGG